MKGQKRKLFLRLSREKQRNGLVNFLSKTHIFVKLFANRAVTHLNCTVWENDTLGTFFRPFDLPQNTPVSIPFSVYIAYNTQLGLVYLGTHVRHVSFMFLSLNFTKYDQALSRTVPKNKQNCLPPVNNKIFTYQAFHTIKMYGV